MTAFEPGVRVEPPPAGLPSGRLTVPRWSIGLAGAVVIALGIGWLVIRAALRRRQK